MARAAEQFLEDRRRLAEAGRQAERRKAEEALRATEAELARTARILSMGEMATPAAHEINQPLTSIVLNADYFVETMAADVATQINRTHGKGTAHSGSWK